MSVVEERLLKVRVEVVCREYFSERMSRSNIPVEHTHILETSPWDANSSRGSDQTTRRQRQNFKYHVKPVPRDVKVDVTLDGLYIVQDDQMEHEGCLLLCGELESQSGWGRT